MAAWIGRRYQIVLRAAFATALAALAVVLLLPGPDLPNLGLWDKLEHAIAFAVPALLGFLAFPSSRHAWPLAFGLIMFGAVCEVLQTFVPGRSASLVDLLADAVGVGVAGGLAWLARARYQQRLQVSIDA
jgi:VanZ family protein